MKKLLIALATTVVLVGPAAATAHAGSAVCAVVLKTSDGFLALRDGPGVGHRLLKKLPRGEKLDMFEPGDNALGEREAQCLGKSNLRIRCSCRCYWVGEFSIHSNV